jgi:hypothetical protein
MSTSAQEALRPLIPPNSATLLAFTSTAPRTALLSHDMTVTVAPDRG